MSQLNFVGSSFVLAQKLNLLQYQLPLRRSEVNNNVNYIRQI